MNLILLGAFVCFIYLFELSQFFSIRKLLHCAITFSDSGAIIHSWSSSLHV